MENGNYFEWDLIDMSKVRGSGDSYQPCPVCSGDRKKHRTPSLSVNNDKGVANCHHCGAKSVRKTNDRPVMSKDKVYKEVDVAKFSDVSDAVLSWFKNERGIYDNTLLNFKIKSTERFFPQVNTNRTCIVFPFYLGSSVVYCKYRTADKHFSAEKNGKLVFYNLNSVIDSEECVIVEGEIDAMSVWQSGYKAVLSVPSGALSLTKEEKDYYLKHKTLPASADAVNLEYIDNSWEYISHIKRFILCVDNDASGYKLRQELIRRLGAESISIVDLEGEKDPNDYLKKHGELKLYDRIVNAQELPIENVISFDGSRSYLMDIYSNGYKMGNETPMGKFNYHYKPRLGELDMWTGIANHGKTWCLMWYCTWTAALYGWKWALYMPENSPSKEIIRIVIEILTGKSFRKGSANRVSPSEIEVAGRWVNKHFYVLDYDDSESLVTMDDILVKFKQLVRKNGIHGCVVDPLNDLHHKKNGMRDDEYYQEMLSKIRRFKQKHWLKFIIAAHPTTEASRQMEEHNQQGKRQRVPHVVDCSGGSIFLNRTDNAVSIYRNIYDRDNDSTTEIHIQKVKWQEAVGRPTPKDDPIMARYDTSTKRYFVGGVDPLFGWFEKNLWGEHQGTHQGAIEYKAATFVAPDTVEEQIYDEFEAVFNSENNKDIPF